MIKEIKQELQRQWFTYLIILVYIVLLAIVLRGHEMWFDEVQAWTITRDNDLPTLVFNYLRYEGHPPLWYLILFIPAHLGFPPQTISLISAIFAILGVYLFVRFSPFPPIIKLLLPFSFYVFYQYAVVARSYSLILFLFSLIAIIFPQRNKRPILYIVILCLTAQLHYITAIVAGVFFVHFLYGLIKHPYSQRHIYGALLFIANTILITFTLFPRPVDKGFPPAGLLSGYLNVGESITISLDFLNYSYTGIGIVTIALLIAFGIYLYQKKSLFIFSAATAAVVIFLGFVYSAEWHEGIIFLILILCLWIAGVNKTKVSSIITRSMYAAFALLLLIHVYWGIYASYNDVTKPYSGSQQMAKYLMTTGIIHREIKFVSFNARSIYAYVPKSVYLSNPYLTEQLAFFFWSETNPWMYIPEDATSEYIIATAKFTDEIPTINGYDIDYIADGSMFWKTTSAEWDTLILYKKW